MSTSLVDALASLEAMNVRLQFEPGTELEFVEQGHLYTYRGMRVPSVTDLLDEFNLIDTTWYREYHAWRGSVVHKCCELLDLNDLDESSVDERVLGYIEAYRAFKSDLHFEPLAIERRIFHPQLRVAGTFDRVGMMGKFPALVDLKSGKPTAAAAIQTAGYAGAFQKPMLFRRFAVQLMNTGRYQMVEYPPETYHRHWAVFSSLAVAHWWKRENRL
jgi:hypothetical protein